MTVLERTSWVKALGERPGVLAVQFGLPLLAFAAVQLAARPEGLSGEGQRSLAVMALAVGLWATGALPLAVTGIAAVILLTLLGAVPDIQAALYGFSQPVPYFLVGILTLGLGVQQSGLAGRLAGYLIRMSKGSPRALYVQMLVSFAALTFALPSASTRGAILVHVYEQVMGRWNIERHHPLNKAVMLAMGSLNRLGSTALLAGGITPVVASALISDFSWTSWFVLMALPFWLILVVGGLAVFLLYRSGVLRIRGARMTGGDSEPRRRGRSENVPAGGGEGRADCGFCGTAVVHRLRPRPAPRGARAHRVGGDAVAWESGCCRGGCSSRTWAGATSSSSPPRFRCPAPSSRAVRPSGSPARWWRPSGAWVTRRGYSCWRWPGRLQRCGS